MLGIVFTEVSSFQVIGIEGVPLYTEVSSFQGVGIDSSVYRGVLVSGCWNCMLCQEWIHITIYRPTRESLLTEVRTYHDHEEMVSYESL